MSRILGAVAFAGALSVAALQPAAAQTKVKFTLDWKFEGPAAGFVVAMDKGYYKAEGLDVTIDSGANSTEGINRVASGTYDMGFADINSLIRFRDKNPALALKGVMMLYDVPPFAIVTLKKNGISGPKGLEGKTLGAPAPDGAYAQWKSFVKENGIDAAKVKIENVGFPVREPMLKDGKVDAITGFSFSSYFNLVNAGVPADQIQVMLMANHGLVLYGNVVMANPDFAAKNPDAVKAFIRATIKGWADSIKDPASAVKSVLKRNDVARESVELPRLKMAIEQNILTPYVKQNGMGGVDMARLARAIEQISVSYEFTNRPKPEDIFTDAFLPPPAQRKVM
ncbi:MAG: ABC transporter substrate-binding protein [Alphaproteobacteria bacterium]|nr:ABC transporter substrate-binding protein [Alphaproteobacteria bacterium]